MNTQELADGKCKMSRYKIPGNPGGAVGARAVARAPFEGKRGHGRGHMSQGHSSSPSQGRLSLRSERSLCQPPPHEVHPPVGLGHESMLVVRMVVCQCSAGCGEEWCHTTDTTVACRGRDCGERYYR